MNEGRQKYLNQIEDYLLGRLNKVQQLELEEAIAKDEVLQQELEEQEKIIKGFRQLRFEKMEGIIEGWEEEITTEEAGDNQAKVIGLNRRVWWGIAAGVALLIIGGVWWFNSSKPYDTAYYRAIASAEYERPELLSTASTKSGGVDTENAFSEAYGFYSAQELEKALLAMSEISDTSSYFRGSSVLKGLIYLDQADYEAAIDAFRSAKQASGYYNLIVKDPSMRAFSNLDVNWYMALAYLGLGQYEQSKSLLQELANQTEYPRLQNQAREILDQL